MFSTGLRLYNEFRGTGSSSSDWDQAQAQDGQGRTGQVPLGQGGVGRVLCDISLLPVPTSDSLHSTNFH